MACSPLRQRSKKNRWRVIISGEVEGQSATAKPNVHSSRVAVLEEAKRQAGWAVYAADLASVAACIADGSALSLGGSPVDFTSP